MQRLPKMLEREPLVEAVCEVRFSGEPQLSEILPGALISKMEPRPQLHRLPAAEIPRPLRMNDPNFVFVPIYRLTWDQYSVSIGDRSITFGCVQPYPKWPAFKSMILGLLNHVKDVVGDALVERYSLKYVNVIEAPTLLEQISKIKISLRLGDVDIQNEQFQLRVEMPEGDAIHISTIVTGAVGTYPDGRALIGAVVDVDSIRRVPNLSFIDFVTTIGPDLEDLRLMNKRKVFSSFTDDEILRMGPVYD